MGTVLHEKNSKNAYPLIFLRKQISFRQILINFLGQLEEQNRYLSLIQACKDGHEWCILDIMDTVGSNYDRKRNFCLFTGEKLLRDLCKGKEGDSGQR